LVAYADGTKEEFGYDVEGRKTLSIDRLGRKITYEYDKLGRLTKQTNPDGTFILNEYDALNRLVSATNELGNSTSFKYDAVGNNIEVIDALGNKAGYEYDKNCNKIKMTDAKGNTIRFEYDKYNRLIKTIFPDGTFTSNVYNCNGLKISESDQAGKTTKYAYDSGGRLLNVIDAIGNKTQFAYDQSGNLISQTDGNNHTVKFEFDILGNRTKRLLPLGFEEAVTYNDVGNIISKTDFNGDKTVFDYDAFGRLVKKSYPDGKTEIYTYNVLGLRESYTDDRGKTTFEYDLMDRLKKQTNPDGSFIAYTYDEAGNCKSVTVPSGTTTYAHDKLNRLLSVTDRDGKVTLYTYDAIGNRLSVTYPNGSVTEYSYDSLSRLTNLVNRKSTGEIISSYVYTLGPAGNRIQVEENTGRTLKYVYDDTYKLIEEEIADPVSGKISISYTYDAVGNRLTKTENGNTVKYLYDENDRIISDGENTYLYDRNGNTLKKTGSTEEVVYEYDYSNRLVKAVTSNSTATSTVEYSYDVDGIRVQKIIDGTKVINYLVESYLDYAQVLEERDDKNSLIVSYVYGNDLISQKRDDKTSYYHYDGIGSTRALTDSNANITDTYTYDSFGVMTSRTGVTENDYLFTGEQYDANVAFYYLRARYMNPSLGRFLTMDSWGGIITDPISLHKYLYANCDPVNNIDPSGNYTLVGVMTTIQIGATIASIAAPVFAGIYLAVVKKVSVYEYMAALCSEDVWIEAAVGIGIGSLMGMGIKAIAKKLSCKSVLFIGTIMSLWSLYESLKLSSNMIDGGIPPKQVARYLAVLTATAILTTLIGKVCFTEDTLIRTEEGYKEIKEIKVGDRVYSENPETGEKGLKRVVNVFINETKVIEHVFVEGEEIKTTPLHPFWVAGKGWVAAGDLMVGDKVQLYSGNVKEISSISYEYLEVPVKVYNFEVEDWHTYFVTEYDILVHNADYGDYGDYDDYDVNTSKPKKGKEFRGGSKKQRDNWYGYDNKDFQKWWEKYGKKDWGGSDIDTREIADEAYNQWVQLGKPKGYSRGYNKGN
jgi:RHS repeat-associated protein